MQKKLPNPTDVHVGSRVRLRRMILGMSQERLGEELGLTFQQVQKYEKGANRIGASRLYQIAKSLDVPVQFFFEDMPDDAPQGPAGENASPVLAFVSSAEGLSLNKAFTQISDARVRKTVLELLKSLGEDQSVDGG